MRKLTFWRTLNSTPNPKFEKVVYGCAVTQELSAYFACRLSIYVVSVTTR
jgi:hypothetical protein